MNLTIKQFGYALALTCLSALTVKAQNPSGVHLIKKTVIGGVGGWDYVYVDSDNRRLYVSHGTQVEVLNADTHEKVGVIEDTKGVHGIVVAGSTGKGYVTCGGTSSVKVFDINTYKVLSEIPAGKKPDWVLYDAPSKRVFVFNNGSASMTVIDAATDKVVATSDLGGAPEEAASDNAGMIFVNLEDKSEIVGFNSKTLDIKKRWKLEGGEEPTGLGFDVKNHRLYSACHNEVFVISDSDKGTVIGTAPIGKGVDGAIFDTKDMLAVSSNGEGSITLVQAASPTEFKVMETVKTEPSLRTCAYDAKTGHIFLIGAQLGEAPAPTAEKPKPRRPMIPGTFMVMEYGK